VPTGFERVKVGFDGDIGHKSGGINFVEIFVNKKLADKLGGIFFDEKRERNHND
jgi:hypothetical protein